MKKLIIGGCGRSGTGVLLRMLEKGGELKCFNETRVFTDRGNILDLARDMYMEKTLELFEKLWSDHKWYRMGAGLKYNLDPYISKFNFFFGLDVVYHYMGTQINRNDRVKTICSYIDHCFTRVARYKSKIGWVEKCNGNILNINELVSGFPDCKFLFCYRHPYDVIASTRSQGWWGAPDLEKVCRNFLQHMNSGLDAIQNHGDKIKPVRFEKLIENEDLIREVVKWLGLEYYPSYFSFDTSRNHNGRWKSELSDEDILVLEELGIDEIALSLDYEVKR